MTAPTLTALLQGFFTKRLARQLQASPQTVAAYRDTIKLLLMLAAQKTTKTPSRLTIDDLDAVTVGAFLSYLDNERHNSTATRNARLATIHSFYRYALPLIPDRAHTASQVLAIPQRRHDRAIVSYLTSPETDALLAAPDRTTWYGRRDHTLLLTTVQTGLRVSEVTGLTIQDITTTTPGQPSPRQGPQRARHPLTRRTAAVLRAWLVGPAPSVQRSRHRYPMSADAVQRLVAKHATARTQLPVDPLQAPPARAPPQLRDVAAPRRRRHLRHRPLAWPRRRPVH
jgi:site-specific recombinase XerD